VGPPNEDQHGVIVPRHRLDVSLGDLLFALAAAIGARKPDRRAARIASAWAGTDEGLACSTVRAGLDCLLSALDLPAGDEVLLSAVTHPDMARIVSLHGLAPVPVDLDLATLAPRSESLERAVTPRTRAILVAHLFGARFDLAEVAAFARGHDLLLIEDCAQTILGPDDAGDPRADVSLYSFGSIKTATALGGALVCVRRPELLARMRELEASWPRQPRREHALKAAKYSVLVLLDRPLPYTGLTAAARLARVNLDRFISTTVRAFRARPGEDEGAAFARWLRRRPSAPLLALLERRLRRFDRGRLERRRHAGQLVAAGLPPELERPGSALADSTFWVFPVVARDPDDLVHALREAGFDATRGTSAIAAIEPPPGRPDLIPAEARRLMAGIVFLPVYPELSRKSLERLVAAIGGAHAEAAPVRAGGAAKKVAA
jgi:dTDP-4-amino-4,6-dideoxygalactose transaminase